MSIPLPQYAKVKDNYCVAYLGNCKEYILQLKLLRPFMEAKYPGVKVYLACKDAYLYLLSGEQRILGETKLESSKNNFGYIRQLNCDMKSHPVESFMMESDIPCGPVVPYEMWADYLTPVIIYPNALPPTRSLSGKQIEQVKRMAESKGAYVEVCPPNDVLPNWARWVIGVENEELFRAAALGIKTSLIPTGFGEKLYKKMFPSGEILKLEDN